MRGKKGLKHADPADPPRRRANKARGHGTWDSDRPPVQGVVGRGGPQMHLSVTSRSTRQDLEPGVLEHTRPGANVYTDQWGPYNQLDQSNRQHATVNHGQHEWARDDDDDGIREVHCNTMEGNWTGLRNFLRTFRGLSKKYLEQYIAIHEWAYRLKTVNDLFLRALLGLSTTEST